MGTDSPGNDKGSRELSSVATTRYPVGKLILLATIDEFPYLFDFNRENYNLYLFTFFDGDGFVVAFKAAVIIPDDPDNEPGDFRVSIAPKAWVHFNSPQGPIAKILDAEVARFFQPPGFVPTSADPSVRYWNPVELCGDADPA